MKVCKDCGTKKHTLAFRLKIAGSGQERAEVCMKCENKTPVEREKSWVRDEEDGSNYIKNLEARTKKLTEDEDRPYTMGGSTLGEYKIWS